MLVRFLSVFLVLWSCTCFAYSSPQSVALSGVLSGQYTAPLYPIGSFPSRYNADGVWWFMPSVPTVSIDKVNSSFVVYYQWLESYDQFNNAIVQPSGPPVVKQTAGGEIRLNMVDILNVLGAQSSLYQSLNPANIWWVNPNIPPFIPWSDIGAKYHHLYTTLSCVGPIHTPPDFGTVSGTNGSVGPHYVNGVDADYYEVCTNYDTPLNPTYIQDWGAAYVSPVFGTNPTNPPVGFQLCGMVYGPQYNAKFGPALGISVADFDSQGGTACVTQVDPNTSVTTLDWKWSDPDVRHEALPIPPNPAPPSDARNYSEAMILIAPQLITPPAVIPPDIPLPRPYVGPGGSGGSGSGNGGAPPISTSLGTLPAYSVGNDALVQIESLFQDRLSGFSILDGVSSGGSGSSRGEYDLLGNHWILEDAKLMDFTPFTDTVWGLVAVGYVFRVRGKSRRAKTRLV